MGAGTGAGTALGVLDATWPELVASLARLAALLAVEVDVLAAFELLEGLLLAIWGAADAAAVVAAFDA